MQPSRPVDCRVGVIGGGQLGRMLGEAAGPLGIDLITLDPTPDAPAARVSHDQIVGAFDDPDAVRELGERCDVLTFEIELADPDLLETISEETNTPVHPSPSTLRFVQDKLVQKRTLQEEGIPVPRFEAIDSVDDLERACQTLGYPAMLKARSGGYDGRGNVPIQDRTDLAGAMSEIDGRAMVEEHVDFVRELSVIGVNGEGEQKTYVPGENVHEAEILRETVVPARAKHESMEAAKQVAKAVLDLVDGRGVFGIELFETVGGEILVNEIAPRPHNSGHWTIEGAVSSQFEQHLRAVCGVPLGSTELRTPIVTANLLGDVDSAQPVAISGLGDLLAVENVKLHWYGKREVRPLRKMGHLAVVDHGSTDRETLLESARDAVERVTIGD